MRITNKIALVKFVRKHTGAENAVNRWVDIVESNDFKGHNELKNIFPAVDYVGNNRYVFNIKGNTYRLVVIIVFVNGTMQVRFCGTHAEYDKIKNIKNL
jgi:mRNA interferase HigB